MLSQFGVERERKEPESSPGTDSQEKGGKRNTCGVRKNPVGVADHSYK